MAKDITNLIERLDTFEERMGVTLEGLFAIVEDNNFVKINGELHSCDGAEIEQNTQVVVSLHDAAGRVIGTSTTQFNAESFFGFETFSILLMPPIAPISKIRIYPKAW
ncbi:MAG: hypothetical protein DYG89_04235 [Caldilinea sp. CFX5]|nr:hypothetical protein [Caldilinea sp. CFX5]